MKNYIILNKRQLCDYELLINGSFYPVSNFMTKDEYFDCLENMTFKHNKKSCIFPIPITLCINEEMKQLLSNENEKTVILKSEDGTELGEMDISDKNGSIYKSNIKLECNKVFNCEETEIQHPYIHILHENQTNGKIYNIGGKMKSYVSNVNHYDFLDLRLSPKEMKQYFKENFWNEVIGFQTRNPMHISHYELTKFAMKESSINKLLIHPIVGITQDCDIDYTIRIKCYKEILKHYDKNNIKLAILQLSMRMAGPREALLHAIIRRNYGCTHFIVGRDHAGPSCKKKDGSSFFEPFEAQ